MREIHWHSAWGRGLFSTLDPARRARATLEFIQIALQVIGGARRKSAPRHACHWRRRGPRVHPGQPRFTRLPQESLRQRGLPAQPKPLSTLPIDLSFYAFGLNLGGVNGNPLAFGFGSIQGIEVQITSFRGQKGGKFQGGARCTCSSAASYFSVIFIEQLDFKGKLT